MTGKTQHYQLEILAPGEPFASDGQQYTTADRESIDRLLYRGAESHTHSGFGVSQDDPNVGASLSASTSGGTLPGGLRVLYKYTWVDPDGFETAASPEVYVDLPAQTSMPNPPTLFADDSGGTLGPGGYYYILSAYTGSDTSETLGSSPAFVFTSTTGSIDVYFPTLPSGATGFNIYRLSPGGNQYFYLTSVAISGGSPTSFTDDGTDVVNPARSNPNSNTTAASNSVTITVPTVPDGFTWNLYRTTTVGNYTNSLLQQVTQMVDDVVTTQFLDVGLGTTIGMPPSSTELIGEPAQIDLTTDVVGVLPGYNIEAPLFVEFSYPGTLSATTGVSVWVCPFSSATIVSATCTLGRGSAPASQDVIADVLLGNGATPTYTSIYSGATPNPNPTVPVGLQIGDPAPPNVTDMFEGDSLCSAILQAGGGATPTDHDLTIVVEILATQ